MEGHGEEKRKDHRFEGVREQDDVAPGWEDTEDEKRKDRRLEQVDVEPGWEETEDEGERRNDHRLEGLEGVRGQVDVEPGWEETEGEGERRGMKYTQNRKTREEDLHSTARLHKLNN